MKWKDILKQEWEIRPCWSGRDCWCRTIRTKGGTIIIDGARLCKNVASYFVALHNAKIRNNRSSNIHGKKFKQLCFFGDECGEEDELQKINKKWKTNKCEVKNCWCREIITEDEYNIVCAGILNPQEAQYFTRLHNNFLKEKNMAMSKQRKRKLAEEKSKKANEKNRQPKKNESKAKGKKKKKLKKR